jgi:hypothetical protein
MGHGEPELLAKLHALAREVFLEFNLGSVIRLDVRADEAGDLYILEANPKPDLKRPADGVTSLICEVLVDYGMSYEDLILSLLADRLDFLFTHRAGSVRHVMDLLEADNRSSGCALEGRPGQPGPSNAVGTSVERLRQVITAVRRAESNGGFLAAASGTQLPQGRADFSEVDGPTCAERRAAARPGRKQRSQAAEC